jgi:hypothetical protein
MKKSNLKDVRLSAANQSSKPISGLGSGRQSKDKFDDGEKEKPKSAEKE